MEKLVQRILQPSLAYDVVLEYKNKLEEKIKRGETSIRSARLAVKACCGVDAVNGGRKCSITKFGACQSVSC